MLDACSAGIQSALAAFRKKFRSDPPPAREMMENAKEFSPMISHLLQGQRNETEGKVEVA